MAEQKHGAVADLGNLLGRLDGHGPHGEVVKEVARRLADSDGWADLDLIAALGAVAPVPADPPRQLWWRAALDALPPVLVFVPILLTWLSLFAASNAYRGLEGDAQARAANAGKSFLELWQQGFDGRLPAVLSFGDVAIYTVITVSLLIATSAVGAQLRRRDEEKADIRQAAADRARAGLLPAVVRAQAELNRSRLGTPARFAAELSQAATGLRELLAQTAQTQDNALALARQNQLLAAKLGGYAVEMRQATGALESASERMRAAAAALSDANALLATEVTGRVEASASRLDQAAGQATAQVDELVKSGHASLDGITERFEAAMAGIRRQIDAATTTMTDAGQQYAAAIGESSGKAAAEIGEVYQAAVSAATVKLVSDMSVSTAKLEAILDGLGRSADTQLSAARRTEQAVAAHTEAVSAVAERISGAVKRMSGAADSMSGAASSVSGTSGLLERAVADYTSIQQQVADSLSGAAASLAAQAAALADRIIAPSDERDPVATIADTADTATGIPDWDASGSAGPEQLANTEEWP